MLIPNIMGWFKMNTAKHINQVRCTPSIPVWQRNYWEHVIRNEDSLNKIREYIINNPLSWHLDSQNPQRTGEEISTAGWQVLLTFLKIKITSGYFKSKVIMIPNYLVI